MKTFNSILDIAQLFVFVGLGVIATWRWRKSGGRSRAWIAATFGSLALAVGMARFRPEDPTTTAEEWEMKLLILLVVVFPVCLFQFMLTFERAPRWLLIAIYALAGVTAIATLLLPEVPGEGERRTPTFQTYIGLLLVYWTFTLLTVAIRLWRAGKGRPTIARKRMRMLSLGALGLALALLISGSQSSPEDHPGLQAASAIFGLLSGPFFLLGFAPPAIVVDIWRRPEMRRFRDAQAELAKALTFDEAVEILLPNTARMLGVEEVIFVGSNGEIHGAVGVEPEKIEALRRIVMEAQPTEVNLDATQLIIPLEEGWLLADYDVYAPYFSREQSQLAHSLASFTDLVLSRARITEKEHHAAKELRAANEAIRSFVAVASHDLRTPITVIKGFAATIASQWEALSDQEKLHYLSMIQRQSDHLSRLVDDLLTLSKLDAHAIEPHIEEISLARAVSETVEAVAHDYDGITLSVPEDLPIRADRDHAFRIVRNYLENAMNHGAPPITLEARRSGNMVELRVRDSGPGVPATKQDQLFERFARIDASKPKSRTSTGLGLSIVRGLAETGGGNAWFEPNAPRGACFVVSWPGAKRREDSVRSNDETSMKTRA